MTTDTLPLSGVYNVSSQRRIWYGPNSLDRLRTEVDRLGGRSVFVIASNTVVTQSDTVDRLQRLLGERSAGVFHRVSQHVHDSAVLAAAEEARSTGADLLVSIGGGSPIDCAKAVALCLADDVTTPAELYSYRMRREGGRMRVTPLRGKPPPHIAVSTTLSAAEFTSVAGITSEAQGAKHLYFDEGLMPAVSILDPTMTRATSELLWATTGMRAVDHCVEGYLSPTHMPFNDALALGALKMLVCNLPSSARDPEDLVRRGRCQVAAWMSMFGIINVSLGLSHALARGLGGRCDVAHGVSSCITLPHVLSWSRAATVHRQAELAEAFAIEKRGRSEEAVAVAFVEALREFIAGLDVPTKLSDVGVSRDSFPVLVQDALEDMAGGPSDRPVMAEDVAGILEAAY